MQTRRPFELAELIAQREQVEQPLGRMLVRPVAGVDDVRLDAFGEKVRGAGRRGGSRPCRCASPRDCARCRRASRPSRRSSPATATLTVSADSRFSANSNEMRVRVDASKNRLTIVDAAQRRHLLDRALADLLERLGGVENEPDLVAATAARGRVDPCRAARVTSPILRHDHDLGALVELLDDHVDALVRPDVDLLADDVRRESAARVRRDR